MQTIEEADSTVFDGIDYCITPSKSASKQSVETVVNIANLLGAKPFFLDPHEHDSYAAAMNYLPIVLSSAFVTATSNLFDKLPGTLFENISVSFLVRNDRDISV